MELFPETIGCLFASTVILLRRYVLHMRVITSATICIVALSSHKLWTTVTGLETPGRDRRLYSVWSDTPRRRQVFSLSETVLWALLGTNECQCPR